MQKIIYITPDGERRAVAVDEGRNLMEGAIRAGVPGILGECGGAAMCATCHVVVERSPAPLPPVGEEEDAMLEEVGAAREPASRLACRLKMHPALDGLVLRVAGME